jgi:hypothetical protein
VLPPRATSSARGVPWRCTGLAPPFHPPPVPQGPSRIPSGGGGENAGRVVYSPGACHRGARGGRARTRPRPAALPLAPDRKLPYWREEMAGVPRVRGTIPCERAPLAACAGCARRYAGSYFVAGERNTSVPSCPVGLALAHRASPVRVQRPSRLQCVYRGGYGGRAHQPHLPAPARLAFTRSLINFYSSIFASARSASPPVMPYIKPYGYSTGYAATRLTTLLWTGVRLHPPRIIPGRTDSSK